MVFFVGFGQPFLITNLFSNLKLLVFAPVIFLTITFRILQLLGVTFLLLPLIIFRFIVVNIIPIINTALVALFTYASSLQITLFFTLVILIIMFSLMFGSLTLLRYFLTAFSFASLIGAVPTFATNLTFMIVNTIIVEILSIILDILTLLSFIMLLFVGANLVPISFFYILFSLLFSWKNAILIIMFAVIPYLWLLTALNVVLEIGKALIHLGFINVISSGTPIGIFKRVLGIL